MNAIKKVYLLIFSQIVAPLALILGLLINVVLLAKDVLPEPVESRLVWFRENPEWGSRISFLLYIVAGVLTLLTFLLSLSLARSKKGGEDEKVGRKIRRLVR